MTVIGIVIRKRYWIMAWGLCCFAAALLWTSSNKPLYHSTVQIYVDEPPVVSELMLGAGGGLSNGVRRLQHETRSSAILDHLVARFELGRHYGIPEGTPFRKERILQRLYKRMEVRIPDQNSLAITLKDSDRDVAARMANEVYRELVRITEQRATADLRRSKRLYATVMKEMEQRARKDEVRMRGILDSAVSALSANGDAGTMGLDLVTLATRMGTTNQELSHARRVDQITAALAQKEPLTRLVLIRKAGRDLDTDPLLEALAKVILLTIVPVLLFAAFLVLWHRQGAALIAEINALVGDGEAALEDHRTLKDRGSWSRVNGDTAPGYAARSSAFPIIPVKCHKKSRPKQDGHLAVVEEIVEQGMDQVRH